MFMLVCRKLGLENVFTDAFKYFLSCESSFVLAAADAMRLALTHPLPRDMCLATLCCSANWLAATMGPSYEATLCSSYQC
jgi:hypothetical protein